jgi:hypothetical protein
VCRYAEAWRLGRSAPAIEDDETGGFMSTSSEMKHTSDQGSMMMDAAMGALAGAAAIWVMDRVDWFMFMHEDPEARRQTQAVRPEGKDPAHVMAGQAAHAMGKEFSNPQQNPAGLAVHYGLGTMPGALYGTMRDRVGGIGAARGIAYGLGLFLLQDEALGAIGGTAARPGQYPWQAHARGFVSHVVYGFVLDAVFAALKKATAGAAQKTATDIPSSQERAEAQMVAQSGATQVPAGRVIGARP